MSTFSVKGSEYDFTIRSRSRLRGLKQECFIVVIRSSVGEEWTGAIHFVEGIRNDLAGRKIGEHLRDAFQYWTVGSGSIPVLFDIPHGIPHEDPQPHRCLLVQG